VHRRNALSLIGSTIAAALAGAAPGASLAHHGWSSFDPNRPLYLRGRVKAVRWRNPHAEVDLEPAPGLALPAGLADRELPAQVSQFDGKGLLARTQLVPRTDTTWTVELAPLTRMQAWSVAPLKEGDMIEVIGYTLTDQSEPVLRAEWLFKEGKVFGLRSSPA